MYIKQAPICGSLAQRFCQSTTMTVPVEQSPEKQQSSGELV